MSQAPRTPPWPRESAEGTHGARRTAPAPGPRSRATTATTAKTSTTSKTAKTSTTAKTSSAEAHARLPVLQRPLASYYLLLTSTALLLAVGLIMVYSASSVRSYASYGSSYAIVSKQVVYVALGLPCMWAASRLSIRTWRSAAYPALLVSLGLLVLVLVPGVGLSIDGATRWIALPGGVRLQPSEFAKLALALWGADLLVRKHRLLVDVKHLFVPLLPVAALIGLLVMLQPDMGTTLTVVAVSVALLWVVGTPLRHFVVFGAAIIALATWLALSAEYRLARLVSFRDPFADAQDTGYQAVQGLFALSSGGWWGVGLGASTAKWPGGLPNVYTDYIVAVLGEELGLVGTLTLLLLVGTLLYSGVRIARRAIDPFARLAASGVIAWIAAQSIINIGAVVGLLPITGIPLPLVSYGGSALITTMIALGMLLSFARCEPGAAEALAARRSAGG